ncbi:ATP-dependent helicase HrpB, partial [Mesorhizobium sp. M1E.F.Ca.ET.063.01.1.1]
LKALHAIDDAGRLTEAGAAMRKLALPVRLAHMVAEAAKAGQALEAATLAVLLTERGLGGDSADLERRLMRFRTEKSPRANAARQLAERLAKPSPSRGGLASALSDAQRDRRGGVGSGTLPATPPRSAARLDL